ncbi:hypothetical protein E0L36_25985 [Streptomyces sp. AJS327]|uniref:hypothetical protein n=1 Tax=Streptomyces sp. AJS327 TaxID=2545265 RepID=UPI0015E00995|nr:hypothetical protein [Streptomyces sp. AJS327]MBA0054176.1 hypothetical protein [Streptomyces sp. AJS327]
MADDRYHWLDGETAERLLQGLPVTGRTAPDASGGSEERLAAALDGLAAEHTPGPNWAAWELPGETEALRAFRETGPAPAAAGARGTRRGRWIRRGERADADERRRAPALPGKPLRAGFAVAVAGCALGGVAVAATAGVLPTPFGGGSPSVSVSPAGSAPQGGSGDGGSGGAPPSGEGRDGTSPDAEERTGGKSPRETEEERAGAGGSDQRSPGESPSDGEERDGRSPGGDREGDDAHTPDRTAVAIALCGAYERGELSPGQRKRLERAAGGPEAVRKFCDRYGQGGDGASGGEGGSGGEDSGGEDGGSDTEGGSGGDDDQGDSDAGGPGSPPHTEPGSDKPQSLTGDGYAPDGSGEGAGGGPGARNASGAEPGSVDVSAEQNLPDEGGRVTVRSGAR